MTAIQLRASDDAVSEVDERYLSFCIDLGQIAEPTRFWNPDGSGETTGRPSYDFGRVRLRNLARALAPALLRIGGTEADRAYYALEIDPEIDNPDQRISEDVADFTRPTRVRVRVRVRIRVRVGVRVRVRGRSCWSTRPRILPTLPVWSHGRRNNCSSVTPTANGASGRAGW